MLSHPTSHSKEITVRDFLINEFNLKTKDNNQREGIVHRLDRVTSGLMVCVLDENIFTYFQSQFKNRLINKKYRAIVEGHPLTKSGEINLPLAKSKKNRKKREVNKTGREAITKFEIVNKTENHALLQLDLVTGRNHQIRAHLEHLKTPIVNDQLYGAKIHTNAPENAICLQSYYLRFTVNDKDYEFEIDMPEYFSSIMNM
tara:strand:- start:36468 stop:37070 length:603 start_codon:yes stop_codon:yes gene_type:complete